MATADSNNIVKRSDKTSPLLQGEVDGNFQELKNVISDVEGLEGTQNNLGTAAFEDTDAFEPAGNAAAISESAADTAVSDHVSDADPHTQYVEKTNLNASLIGLGAVRNVTSYSQTEADSLFESRLSANMVWDPVSDDYSRDSMTSGVTPVHERMRRCVVADDGSVVYYLDPNDSNLKADGTASDLTGTDGQVMVEIPKFYVRISKLRNLNHYLTISTC